MSALKPAREPAAVRMLAVDLYAIGGAVFTAQRKLRAAAMKYEGEAIALAHIEYEDAKATLQEHVAKVEAFIKRL